MQTTEIYQKITETMPNCRVRPSQLEMVNRIDECFGDVDTELKDGSNIAVIEAPTGTGKSMAYLLAGVLNSKKLGKKLVITTGTKALQSQLVEKDIPAFIKYSGVPFSYIQAKGRSNYLCPYQLELSLGGAGGDLFTDSSKLKEELKEIHSLFNYKKWDGDLDSLPFGVDHKVKVGITTDKERCLASSCPYNTEDDCKCPFYLNRAKLKYSEVIITNHSLLLSDLSVGAGNILAVKPENYLLCIDEGHNLSEIAINSFSQKFELKHAIGICQNLARLIYNPENNSYVFTDIPLCDKLLEHASNLAAALDDFLLLLTQNLHLINDNKIILNDYLNPNLDVSFRDQFVNFADSAFELYKGLVGIVEKLKTELKEKHDALIETNLNKLGFYVTVIESILATSGYIINKDDSRYNANAKWIEIKSIRGHEDFVINAGLTHAGKRLFDTLWSKVYACIVTSATFAVGEDFTYYKHKLGLNLFENVHSYKLGSSFSYKDHSQVVVPRFKFAPEYKFRDEFTSELIAYLATSLDYEGGYGTLVLFFNRKQLTDTYDMLPKRLQKRILSQTEYVNNGWLLSDHKKRIEDGLPSIIFGLNSFAEGVDLPGLYCLHVIITKLPFDTHKDPQSMVLEYWVKYEKGNYFTEVSLPEACIRLVQAAGRLIRDEGDYGQVSICDNRLITKEYGRTMLDALPEFNRKYNDAFLTEAFMKVSG